MVYMDFLGCRHLFFMASSFLPMAGLRSSVVQWATGGGVLILNLLPYPKVCDEEILSS